MSTVSDPTETTMHRPESRRIDHDPPGVKTVSIPRPRPTVEPPRVELTHLASSVRNVALLSGGDDSLVAVHDAMEKGLTDIVVYADTNSGLAQNIDFVRRVCRRYSWPLLIVPSPMPLERFVMRYGWPGATESGHGWAYRYFKGRVWRWVANHIDGEPRFFTGARRDESGRRRVNITDEVQRETNDSGDFEGWWVSHCYDKSDEWVAEYLDEHDLPTNPIKDVLHRSGDCFCMAFGHRDEVLVDLASHFPRHYHWLMNVERRAQEYRGRLLLVQDDYPAEYDRMNERRKSNPAPYPMRMTVLQEHFPDRFRDAMSHDRADAVHRAAEEHVNWLGHGGMSSDELQQLVTKYDRDQPMLCEFCG